MAVSVMPLSLPKIRRLYLVQSHSQLIIKVATKQCSDSFKDLFSYYSPKIYSYGISNQLSEALAKDLVQEVMTLIWTKANYYSEDKGTASTWIFTLARNLRFDLLRKKNRESNVISAEDIWSSNTSADFIDQDADLEQIQSNKDIRQFVDQLPDTQRDAVVQVYYTGLTQDEYASKKGIPLGTVKSRIRLAIRKLNHLLEAR